MKKFLRNPKTLWYLILIGFVVVFFTLWQVNKMINTLRHEEQKQVELWAKAISKKAEMVTQTKDFYGKTIAEEQRKLEQFIEAYKIIMSQPEDVDLTSPKFKFYTKILMDNKMIPVVVTDEFNNIQFSQNVDLKPGQKTLVGDLYKKFSKNPPYEYEVYGMKFKLYYCQSYIYESLKSIMDELMNNFLTEITDNSISVPVVITDSTKKVALAAGNIDTNLVRPENLEHTLERMSAVHDPIKISLPLVQNGYIFYQKSFTLTLLQYYPLLYVFLFVVFGFLMFQVFRAMKLAEQNSVWVGMGKETAHQLGTPISSLMAWVELLKMNPDNEATCEEINKDIDRLNTVSKRFSQIGSNPTLKQENILPVIASTISYLSTRSPKRVSIESNIDAFTEIVVPFNSSLIEWTIENISKNAIDAMEGNGKITISLEEDDNKLYIDIADTGKGMPKSQFKKIFQPGYTTKQRGWGLGLSLVKRIVEEYHTGKIYVKSSVIGQGTTFRIELPKTTKKRK